MCNFKDLQLQILAVLCVILVGAALLAAGLVSPSALRGLIMGLMPFAIILLFVSGIAGAEALLDDFPEDRGRYHYTWGPEYHNKPFIY